MTGVGVVEVAVIGPEEEIGRDGITLIGRLGKTHLRRAKKYPNQVPVRITVNHRSNSTKSKTDLCFVGDPLRVRRVEAEIIWKLSTQYILLFSVRGFRYAHSTGL